MSNKLEFRFNIESIDNREGQFLLRYRMSSRGDIGVPYEVDGFTFIGTLDECLNEIKGVADKCINVGK